MDTGTFAVAAITLALFVAALFVKGLSHDLFLEAGVFLVSVKLLMMARKAEKTEERIAAKLDDVLAAVHGRPK